MRIVTKKFKHKKAVFFGLILFAAIIVLIISSFKLENITVEGNVLYTDDEIKAMLDVREKNNTVLFYIENKLKPYKNTNLIDKIEITILDINSVNIRVYEKTITACVEHMGMYVYLDREGHVVDSSADKRAGVIEVKGLIFNSIVLREQLPISNVSIFVGINELVQNISKYNLAIDTVYFDENYNITMYSENIRILCGQAENISTKLSKLQDGLLQVKGKSGELDIRNVNKNIIFKEDIKESIEEKPNEENENSEETQ